MSTKVSRVQAKELRERAKRAAQAYDRGAWELARFLWEASDWFLQDGVALWKVWGFDSWLSWATQELGIGKNRAIGLRAVHETFVVTFRKFHHLARRLTISQLERLTGAVNINNVEEALLWARDRTLLEIEGYAARLRGKARGDRRIAQDKHMFTARVTTQELADIEQALQLVRTWDASRTTRKGFHVAMMALCAKQFLEAQKSGKFAKPAKRIALVKKGTAANNRDRVVAA